MDILPEIDISPAADTDTGLSYDDSIPYSELPPPPATISPEQSSLAGRIGQTKVYLISDALAKTGKVRCWAFLA